MEHITLNSPISALDGIGKVRSAHFEKANVLTVADLLFYFPRAHEARGNVRPLSSADLDNASSYMLTVATQVYTTTPKRGLTISKFKAFDETGNVDIVFFNTPFVKNVFQIGTEFRFYGKITLSKGKLQLTNPKYEPYISGIPLLDYVPIYPSLSSLSSKQIEKLIKQLINDVLPKINDYLPDKIRIKHQLPTLSYAIKNAHFPESGDALKRAMTRLAFDEIFKFGIAISTAAKTKRSGNGIKFSPCKLKNLTDLLPYELTSSQKNTINDIYKDTVIGNNGIISPMSRIIVGDVGSGKTVCAIAALYIASCSGYQSALMVPTEILARQHFNEIKELFSTLDISCELLLGSTTKKEKNRIYDEIASGKCSVIIGTHALLSDKLSFSRLGLVITDEQHRLGVNQRTNLKEKEKNTHMLVMSATPIPRTLALALYGDLDVSRINEMPKGRMRVDTYVVDESYRKRLNNFIEKQVETGGQCYIVCPSIEKTEEDVDTAMVSESISSVLVNENSLNLKNTDEYAKDLKNALPNVTVEVLHGKMKPNEKDKIMADFSSGKINVLVSTTVIEVGVNVPNASLMIVENAERFGLAQLHQLRGRVGRGTRKSYCVLVSDMKSEKSKARLEVMKNLYDGYEIAEKDLLLRGPGDFFAFNSNDNLRQSGGFEFEFASKCDNTDLFDKAFSSASELIIEDPDLSSEENRLLLTEINKRIKINSSTIS